MASDYLQERVQKELSFKLKDEQFLAVKELMQGNDVLAVLPTGFGKSRIYQAFTSLKNTDTNQRALVLVISPLDSLIKDQLLELKDLGYVAKNLADLSTEELSKCEFSILLSSAEEASRDDFQRELKTNSSNIHERFSCLVVDECHTVETWTGNRNRWSKSSRTKAKRREKPAFRACYGKLSIIRSLCKQGVPVLALTGTADKESQKVICDQLLMTHPITIFMSPNRVNLRISVCKCRKDDMHIHLDWLVAMIKEHGIGVAKTIIFCNTLKEIAIVVDNLLVKLGEHAFSPSSSRDKKDLIIGIFHSTSWPESKERIMKSLRENGTKRVIVASTALSMGVNFPDIRYIINWGPARNLLDFHQEAGRAGRDGKLSHVVVVYHGNQLANCEDDVKDFVNSTGCYRVASYKPFDSCITPLSIGHNCCSNCSKLCNCGAVECKESLPFEQLPECNTLPTKTREVTDSDKKDIESAFDELIASMHVACSVFGEATSHGFSQDLIASIIKNCSHLFTLEDVNALLPVFSVNHAVIILEVLDEIFGDIPNISVTSLALNEHLRISNNDKVLYKLDDMHLDCTFDEWDELDNEDLEDGLY